MKISTLSNRGVFLAALLLCLTAGAAHAAANEAVLASAKKERPALLDTLKELTAIESGSRELEGLDKIAQVLANRLRALGGKVEMIEASETDTVRLSDTPEKLGKMVKATFTGTGTKKILLMAHMDTVYPKGMLAGQPFKIDGDRVYTMGAQGQLHCLQLSTGKVVWSHDLQKEYRVRQDFFGVASTPVRLGVKVIAMAAALPAGFYLVERAFLGRSSPTSPTSRKTPPP